MIAWMKMRPWEETMFYMALALYAVFSSPTPDRLGIPEAAIAILLILSLRLGALVARPVESICFAVAVCVPTITGLMTGNNQWDMLRDIIALGFFFLPLFFGKIVSQSALLFQTILASMGVVFAVRAIIPYADIVITPSVWGQGPPADLMYLANSPEVLFAALWGIQRIFNGLIESSIAWKKVSTGLVCVLIPMLAMALMMQRAGMMMVGICALLYGAVLLYRAPLRAFGILPLGFLFLFIGWDIWADVWNGLWQKNMLVGANGRLAEWSAVWGLTSDSPMAFLFGHGWGTRFEDPAVGGLPVTYTHSLVSFLLLKTGATGFLVIMAGIGAGIVQSLRQFPCCKGFLWRMIPVLFPLFIAVFLYASYKSLGFGLILCAFWDNPVRKLEKTGPVVS